MLNSRLIHFTATPRRSGSKSHHDAEHPLFRSYGAILPSSLTRVISSALGFSPRLPVSDCGTVVLVARGTRLFLAAWGHPVGSDRSSPSDSPRGICPAGFAWPGPLQVSRSIRQELELPFRVPPSLKRYDNGAGIFTCFPSTTPFGLALGTDSPWEDYPCPGNLRLTANGFFTRFIVTNAGILTSRRSSRPRRSTFTAPGMLSYHSRLRAVRSFGAMLEPRYIFRAEPFDQ